LIEKARRVPGGAAAANAAQAFMAQTLRPIVIEDKNSARRSGRQYDEFHATLASHITALTRACSPCSFLFINYSHISYPPASRNIRYV
jgi:hypothetical protein